MVPEMLGTGSCPVPARIQHSRRLGTRWAPLHFVYNMVFIYLLTIYLFSFFLKENFRGLVAATSGRTTTGSQPGPGNRSQCGLILSSNNPVLGFSVGGLGFILKLRGCYCLSPRSRMYLNITANWEYFKSVFLLKISSLDWKL